MLTTFKDIYFRKKMEIDLLLGQILYKNRTGYKLSREGYKRWEANKKIAKITPRIMQESHDLSLGYHIFSMLRQETLLEIKKSYNSIILDKNHTYITARNGEYCEPDKASFLMVKNIVRSIPNVLELITSDIMDLLYSYYNSHFHISYVSAYRTIHIDENEDPKEVYAYKFHYDRHITDTLKLFVLLTDVTLDDGPFTFFDRIDSKKILASGYKERDNYGRAKQMIESGEMTKYLTGKKGTAAICDTTRCLHRAGIPKIGRTRDLLIFSFESFSEPLDIHSSETRKSIENLIDQENRRYK